MPITEGASNQRTAILASPPVALKPAQLDLNKPPELVNLPLWQGGRGMRIMTAAFALGTALVLCNLGTFSGVAQARTAKVVREPPRERLIVTVPVVRPYWDSYIVPRYRYRPEDDRIDPYGPPVVPVIRYGNQEVTLPAWFW
jgi:hypothetical protein